MCSDGRIGNAFFYPGLGYGGSCFPKDVLACISMGRRSETAANLLAAVHEVNLRQRDRFFRRIEAHFGGQLDGKRIAVWGVAFKPGTDDIREAPAITLIRRLLERHAEVVAYDPVALDHARELFGDKVACVDDAMAALAGADALVICTNWGEFLHPDFDEMLEQMDSPVVFDGRNLYRPEAMAEHGFTYYSIGRGAATPASAQAPSPAAEQVAGAP
jgi:UDPglucose 6-dehydrogenase